MADLTINADDIAAALRKGLEGYSPRLETQQVGRIIEVGDGIARISGLPQAFVNELLEFEGGTLGLASTLTRSPSAPSSWATRATSRKAKTSLLRGGFSPSRWVTVCWAGWSTPSAN